MLLLLLIDAFRPDYLQKTDFLRYLAHSGAHGVFEEPFGYSPHASYFGGVTPGDVGYAYQFWRDPDHSPFHCARLLPDDSQLGARSRAFVRETLLAEARSRTTAFGASYIHPHNIPIRLLPEIDLAEKYPPWDNRAGYRSLFHELAEQGRPWLYAGWPSINDYGLRRDGDIVSWALDRVRPDHAFVHVQLCDLDGIGHRAGPGSNEMLRALEQTDRLVRLLLEGLMAKSNRLDVLIFGDHGMVSVARRLDVASRLSSLRAQAPVDYFYFLDSTAARFWFHHAAARDEVKHALRSLHGGHLLTPDERRFYEIEGLDPRSGEEIFLADPGVLISPSFFDAASNAPRGMHGYDPREPDNQGIFIGAGPSFRSGTDAGIVDGKALNRFCRTFLFDAPAEVALEPIVRVPSSDGPALNGSILPSDWKVIKTCIAQLDPSPDKTVVLAGSFGRGEGAIIQEPGGQRAVNDYDILVFSPTTVDPAAIRAAREQLAGATGLPFMDLSWFKPEWANFPERSIFRYDLRYGARVLSGDHGFLDRLPHLAEADIPSAEVLRLLCNRAAGILMGLTADTLSAETLSARDLEFLWIQVMKAGVSLADHHLFRWGAYHTSYRVRRRRFGVLSAAAGFAEPVRTAVDACFSFKLDPASVLSTDPRHILRDFWPDWLAAIEQRLAEEPELQTACTDHEAEAGHRVLWTAATRYLEALALVPERAAESARTLAALMVSTLDEGLRPMPELLLKFAGAPVVLGILGESSAGHTADCMAFDGLRKRVIERWEEHCH